jgi:histidinol-phosphatase (PHP family)
MHFDAHVHSAVSPDSEMDPREAIAVLARKGLGVAFTEHCDFHCDFMADMDRYHGEYPPLRSDRVLMGLELSLVGDSLAQNEQAAAGEYDFIVGAVHTIEKLDLYYEGRNMDPRELCRRYLTYAREMVELCGFFDSLAHIDYIARYIPGTAEYLQYREHPGEFDALLASLAQRDKAMEINTVRLGERAAERGLLPIYRRFRELGGRYATIGSDAHRPRDLGRHYAIALRIARAAGLTPVYYKERKVYPCER